MIEKEEVILIENLLAKNVSTVDKIICPNYAVLKII